MNTFLYVGIFVLFYVIYQQSGENLCVTIKILCVTIPISLRKVFYVCKKGEIYTVTNYNQSSYKL